MSVRKIKTIAVDEKFFNNIFDAQRKILQEKLGVINLSQINFTKMITGLKFITPKRSLFIKIKRGKTNGLCKI